MAVFYRSKQLCDRFCREWRQWWVQYAMKCYYGREDCPSSWWDRLECFQDHFEKFSLLLILPLWQLYLQLQIQKLYCYQWNLMHQLSWIDLDLLVVLHQTWFSYHRWVYCWKSIWKGELLSKSWLPWRHSYPTRSWPNLIKPLTFFKNND